MCTRFLQVRWVRSNSLLGRLRSYSSHSDDLSEMYSCYRAVIKLDDLSSIALSLIANKFTKTFYRWDPWVGFSEILFPPPPPPANPPLEAHEEFIVEFIANVNLSRYCISSCFIVAELFCNARLPRFTFMRKFPRGDTGSTGMTRSNNTTNRCVMKIFLSDSFVFPKLRVAEVHVSLSPSSSHPARLLV